MRPLRRADRGSMLACLMVTVAIMSIMLTVATQQWSFIVRREKEKELVFRGQRIQAAIQELQATGRPVPSLEQLTKAPRPALRAVPVDPMTARYDRDGKLVEGTGQWVLIRLGQPSNTATPPPEGSKPAAGGGQIIGVHSSSEEASIGSFGNVPAGSPYSQWKFQTQQQLPPSSAQAMPVERPFPPGFGGLRRPGRPPGPPIRGSDAARPQGSRPH